MSSAKCWICQSDADSAEHVTKKTDVKAVFGPGPYKGIVRRNRGDGSKKPVQGPNSQALKFGKSICAKCNNERTQPYDKAYEKFSGHVRENASELAKRRKLRTTAIYGKPGARKEQENLLRYYAKSLGCALAEHGLEVPTVLVAAMNGRALPKGFELSFCLSPGEPQGIQVFDLIVRKDSQGNVVGYQWAQDNGAFTAVYLLNFAIGDEFGKKWSAKSKEISFGSWDDVHELLDEDPNKSP